MTFEDDVLNRLAPVLPWEPDWTNVIARAGEHGRRQPPRLRARRRLVVALAVLAAVLIPLIALGAVNQWWFFKGGFAPTPTATPVVVKEGSWGGRPWELDAYRSTTDGLCFAMTATGAKTPGKGAAMGCVPFVGIARTKETKATPDLTITYLSRGGNKQFPAYIAGPVIDNASHVEIRFADGQVLRVQTFAAPASLGHVRFYATPLPAHEFVPTWVAGLDKNGNVIACFVADRGGRSSPPSACK
jgi:hypothetical protein